MSLKNQKSKIWTITNYAYMLYRGKKFYTNYISVMETKARTMCLDNIKRVIKTVLPWCLLFWMCNSYHKIKILTWMVGKILFACNGFAMVLQTELLRGGWVTLVACVQSQGQELLGKPKDGETN